MSSMVSRELGDQTGLQQKEMFLLQPSTIHTNPMLFLTLKLSPRPPLFLVNFYIRLAWALTSHRIPMQANINKKREGFKKRALPLCMKTKDSVSSRFSPYYSAPCAMVSFSPFVGIELQPVAGGGGAWGDWGESLFYVTPVY